MPKLYAIADPHGCLDVLENALNHVELNKDDHLYLLGDYIPHPTFDMTNEEYLARCHETIAFVRDYHYAHKPQVHPIMGNHEFDLIERIDFENLDFDPKLLRWMRNLAYYYETDRQIFVHAGINEQARTNWRIETPDEMFVAGRKPDFVHFEKDVIMGHRNMTHGKPGVFWDKTSHYYLDANTEKTGLLNILCYDEDAEKYSYRVITKDTTSGVYYFEDTI